jgi:hypothetical protein
VPSCVWAAKEKQKGNKQNWEFTCQNGNRRNGQEKLKTNSVSVPASWSPNSDQFRIFLTKMGTGQEKQETVPVRMGIFLSRFHAHATPTAML